MLDENGLVPSAYWPYLDWAGDWENGVPTGGRHEPIAAHSMLYAVGLKCAQTLAQHLGRPALAEEYAQRRTSLNRAIKKHFWNDQTQYYKDTLTNTACSQHTAIWAILAEIETGEAAKKLAKIMLNPQTTACSFSMSFFLFRALEKIGMYGQIFPLMDGFLKMMDQHCTTWCENPGKPRSECHGWSAVPLYEWTTGILGVKQTAIGFTKAEICPEPFHLTYAKGSVPTPFGNIDVQWEKQGDILLLSYRAPREIEITLGKNVRLLCE